MGKYKNLKKNFESTKAEYEKELEKCLSEMVSLRRMITAVVPTKQPGNT